MSLICMTSQSMILLLPIVLFLSIHYEIDLPKPLESWSLFLQNACIQQFYNPSNPSDLSASFICGKKVTLKSNKVLLQSSGIYHAIVVSGGHFLFLEAILQRLALPAVVRFAFLFIYYLMTGLQPPGLRCLVQIALVRIFDSIHLKSNSTTLCFYSGLLCLAMSFPFWQSLSFWLSFSVSMSLCYARIFQSTRDPLHKKLLPLFFIYLFIIPFNATSGYLHPLNLLLGMLLLEPFCFVLLTSAVLVFSGRLLNWDFLLRITVEIDRWLFQLLQKWTLLVPDRNTGATQPFYYWLYVLILIALLHLLSLFYRRETIHE